MYLMPCGPGMIDVVRNRGVSGREERTQMHNVVRMSILMGVRQ